MRTRIRTVWLATGLVAAALLSRPLWAGAPEEVAFQCRISDTNGVPLDGPVARLVFRLYSADTGGTFLWGEAHTNKTAARGVVSLTLGRGQERIDAAGASTPGNNPLTAPLFDGTTRWLEITVNTNTLSPRLPFVSVPYAISAGTLNGKTEAELTGGGGPVGTIVDWYRPTTTTAVPAGWALCNGDVVNDAASPFNGKPTPDLRNRFVRGLDDKNAPLLAQYGASSANPLPDRGGTNSVSLNLSHNHDVGSHTHSINSDGGHNHGANLGDSNGHITANPTQNHGGSGFFVFDTFGPGPSCTHNVPVNVSSVGGHSHGGQTGGAGGQTSFALGSPSFDPTPTYTGLLKIMRIK